MWVPLNLGFKSKLLHASSHCWESSVFVKSVWSVGKKKNTAREWEHESLYGGVGVLVCWLVGYIGQNNARIG